jgi:hypothetical protein
VTEGERAALFRQQCANRAQWRQDRAAALLGDATAAARVHAAWAPLLRSPLDDWDCIPVEDIDVPIPAWLRKVPGDVELPEHLKRRIVG